MRIRMPIVLVGTGLTCVGAFASGCGGSAGPGSAAVLRTDSAGIEIVRNSGSDRPLGWALKPLFTVGGADSGPESFFQVQGLGADSAGDLYVLDGGNKRVVVFGPAGQVVRTEGHEGQGPGELSMPFSISVRPDGSVRVYDERARAFVGYGPSGEVLPSVHVTGFAWGPPSATGAGFIGVFQDVTRSDSVVRRLLRVAGEDTTELARISLGLPAVSMFESCGVGLRMQPVFTPRIRWSNLGQDVVEIRGVGYVVDRFRGDSLVASYRRDLRPRPASETLARRELGDGLHIGVGGGSPRVCKTEEIVSKVGVAPVIPTIKGLALSPDGMVWIEHKVVGRTARGPIDVLSPRGVYLGSLPAGTPLPGAFLPGDRIAALAKDSLGVERVTEYKVERSGS